MAQYGTITMYRNMIFGCIWLISPPRSSQTQTHKLLYGPNHWYIWLFMNKNHVYLWSHVSKQWAWIHLSELQVTFTSQSPNYHILIAIETETETVAPECAKTNRTMFIECDCGRILHDAGSYFWLRANERETKLKKTESLSRERKKLINKINVRCVWIFVFILAHPCVSRAHFAFCLMTLK